MLTGLGRQEPQRENIIVYVNIRRLASRGVMIIPSFFFRVMRKNFDSVPTILVCGCDLCGLETGVVVRVAVQHEIGGCAGGIPPHSAPP